MTIKSKISFYIIIIFTLFFGIISMLVVWLFSNFRKQEFEEILKDKALTSIELLADRQEADKSLLKIIDQNSINKLYNEKTLIFDAEGTLIYSSLDDTKISWSAGDLDYLRKHKSFFKKDVDNELYGFYYDTQDKDFYALVSANDNYGKRKLNFLISIMVGAWFLFSAGTWFFSFYIVKKQLLPLDRLLENIKKINHLNILDELYVKPKSNNEIDLISNEFNFMLLRLNDTFLRQKEFTAQASHELRTPLARISVQLENYLQHLPRKDQSYFNGILSDLAQLNELINSLLILARIEDQPLEKRERVRIDECIYNSIDRIVALYPDVKINLTIQPSYQSDSNMEVIGNGSLLEIAFTNLFKNAYLYGDRKVVSIDILDLNGRIAVRVTNSGEPLTEEEQKRLFKPFMRGKNAVRHTGVGLGLRIVHRILSTYGYKIEYAFVDQLNTFTVSF